MRRKSERVKSSPSVKQPESVTRRTSRRNKKSPEKSITEEESENTSDHGSHSETEEEVVVKKRTKRGGGRASAVEDTPTKSTTRSRRKTTNKKDADLPASEDAEPEQELEAIDEKPEDDGEQAEQSNHNIDKNDKHVIDDSESQHQTSHEEAVEISINVNESLLISQELSTRESEPVDPKPKRLKRRFEEKVDDERKNSTVNDEQIVVNNESIPEDSDKIAQVSTTTPVEVPIEEEPVKSNNIENTKESQEKVESIAEENIVSEEIGKINGKVTSAIPVEVVSTKPKLLNKNRENEASAKAPIVRKRKWLSNKSATPKVQEIAISSDSLKGLISDVKPVPLSDVKLESSPEPDQESDDVKVVSSTSIDFNRRSEERTCDGSPIADDSNDGKLNALNTSRKVSIIQDGEEPRPPSPAKHTPCNILYITNLVRPFTVLQLKGLLQRTGKIVEDGFWIDKIKSKCFVKYETEDEAVETRHALHGIRWPMSNPKCLNVDFGNEALMEKAIASTATDIKPLPSRDDRIGSTGDYYDEKEKVNSEKPVREWDVGKKPEVLRYRDHDRTERDGRTRDNNLERGDRDRDRNDRRRRSVERHRDSPSASPSRKISKKENDPPLRLLDDLFRKTKTTPCIYWLPLTPEQIAVREQERLKQMAEHKRRLEVIKKEREDREENRGRGDRDRDRDRGDRRRRGNSRDRGGGRRRY